MQMSLCLVILTLAAQRDNTAIPSIPVSFYYTAFLIVNKMVQNLVVFMAVLCIVI